MSQKKALAKRAFFLVTFLCANTLSVALFDIGYKSHFASKELVMLGLVDLLFAYAFDDQASRFEIVSCSLSDHFPMFIVCF